MRSWWLVLLSLMVCTPLFAQDVEVTLRITGEQVKMENMAIPDFPVQEDGPGFQQAAKTLAEVLRQDIVNSGVFRLLGKERIALMPSPHGGAPIDFDQWTSIEAQFLVVGSIKRGDGEEMRVEVRLFEISSQGQVLAKAYRSKPGLARKMGHVIADEILFLLKGRKFATSKIIYAYEAERSTDNRLLKELYIMDYDGHNALPLTKRGISFAPSAVRKGRDTLLAYSRFSKAGTIDASYGIAFKPTLASRPKPLLDQAGLRASAPAISPDGKRILFSMAKEGNVDVYVMDLNGNDAFRLTRHPAVDTNPSWSPGGHAILYTSDRNGSPQVYRMDADGLNNMRLTRENPYNDSAVWNPVHDYIAYVSRFENDFDIFIMDLKSGQNYRVTRRQGSNEDPSWSPDGEQLAFTSNRTGTWQIYLVNLNGMNLRQITNQGNNRAPVWVAGD
ncbi:DPP IV N-terminal domain-containing protein [Acanthopleuribacter pedis]|uniref:PD40 domain-containing protein n=1 Tax=Acanthopleuribacter pedis TaxID=442870 RepID=A0A8J7Q7I0_9BACT|nr:DPP IV N-terminal domain-containing protein [Acanthopleuribacter pedis]MBO1319771.1 PD40 domain-containing protein [Acanthopleuribacter pedis]